MKKYIYYLIFILINLNFKIGFSQLKDNILLRLLKENNITSINDLNTISPEKLLSLGDINSFNSIDLRGYSEKYGIDESLLKNLINRYKQLKNNNNAQNVLEGINYPYDNITSSSVRNNYINNLPIFASNIFSYNNVSLENINSPVPKNYLIKKNDKLNIDVFGLIDKTEILQVDFYGNIRYPNVGPINIEGLTLMEAELKIKQALSKIYNFNNNKTLLKIKIAYSSPVLVKVIGQVNFPGSYIIPNYGTIINALTKAEGPNYHGSYRDIILLRNGVTISHFDIYSFYINADISKNYILEDEDIILIKPLKKRVVVSGRIKQPAYYELIDSENFITILDLCGGFEADAVKEWISIFRYGKTSREVFNIEEKNFSSFTLQDGDSIVVSKIFNEVSNKVIINGATLIPGTYAIETTKNIYELIKKAGIAPGALLNIASLYRKDSITQKYFITKLDLTIEPEKLKQITLKPHDSIFINRYIDVIDNNSIEIIGEVVKPGIYNFTPNMKLNNLLILARGFKYGASRYKIEISRRIINQDTFFNNNISKIYQLEVDSLSIGNEKKLNFPLQPYDLVTIRKIPNYNKQKIVYIDGEVPYPGSYVIENDTLKIRDLILMAGGINPNAYIQGITLFRENGVSEQKVNNISNQIVDNIINKNKDNNVNETLIDNLLKPIKEKYKVSVGIQFETILKNSKSAENLLLVENDFIYIPKKTNTIRVLGEINSPKTILYKKSLTFKQAINQSGGYSINADKSNSYVIYANGNIKSTKKFLFFRKYPKLKPGADILVLNKPPFEKLSITQKLAILSAVASFSLITLTLYNYLKVL